MRLRWKADMALTSFLEDEDEDEDSPRPLLSLPEEELVVVVALSWDSLPVDIVGGVVDGGNDRYPARTTAAGAAWGKDGIYTEKGGGRALG